MASSTDTAETARPVRNAKFLHRSRAPQSSKDALVGDASRLGLSQLPGHGRQPATRFVPAEAARYNVAKLQQTALLTTWQSRPRRRAWMRPRCPPNSG